MRRVGKIMIFRICCRSTAWDRVEKRADVGGIWHAATYLLAKIGHIQVRFLRELRLAAEQAFLESNFAPPKR